MKLENFLNYKMYYNLKGKFSFQSDLFFLDLIIVYVRKIDYIMIGLRNDWVIGQIWWLVF